MITNHDLGVVVNLGNSEAAGLAMGHAFKGYFAATLKKITIDKSVLETGGIKETMAIGQFDFYH